MNMNPVLKKLAQVVSRSEDLESFVRPLLQMLETVTGLESTYLTTIDTKQNVQKILFARNTQTLNIPEGLSVPWDDTLCKRSIDEGRAYTDNVDTCWSDSSAAKELGITTYLSQPVHVGDGELFGTLCGASRSSVQLLPQAHELLSMFSRLIARQVERERLLERLREENEDYIRYALSDPLTGIPNRRALTQELTRALVNVERSGTAVHVAFIDLDGFKRINDEFGHDAGDRFLIQIANRLTAGVRQGDFVARYGGDEFVVFGLDGSGDFETSRIVFRERLESLIAGSYSMDTTAFACTGASVGVITAADGERDTEDVIKGADAAMYEIKKTRRS